MGEGWEEDILGVIRGTPRSNEQQKTNGIKGRRLDEHGDDGHVQSGSSSGPVPHGISNIPAVHDEPYDDHDCEDDVDRKGNRKVWNAEVNCDGVPKTIVWLCGLVDEHGTHRCVSIVSREYHCQLAEDLEHIPKHARYIKQGKAMIQ